MPALLETTLRWSTVTKTLRCSTVMRTPWWTYSTVTTTPRWLNYTNIIMKTPLHSRPVKAQTLLIDTSLATLILDGELWERSPTDLCMYRPELCTFLAQGSGKDPHYKNVNLRRSLAAYSWASCLRKPETTWRGDLRITPTVIMELFRARQVILVL